MDDEILQIQTGNNAAKIQKTIQPLVLIGFVVLGWCLYRRLKN